MKEISIKFEYKCFPIWIYDNGNLLDNDLPEELLQDKQLDKKLVVLQEEYNALFIDDDFVFKWQGFPTDKARLDFLGKISAIETELHSKLSGSYIVKNETRV